MFKKTKTKNIGKVILNRVKDFQAWAELPKKRLKKHPAEYILCPDFLATVPKVFTREGIEATHSFTVKIVAKTRPTLRKMLDHMIICAQEPIIVGDKCFELCGLKESTVKIGIHTADLILTFKLRQLSYIEIKEIKKSKMTEEKHG